MLLQIFLRCVRNYVVLRYNVFNPSTMLIWWKFEGKFLWGVIPLQHDAPVKVHSALSTSAYLPISSLYWWSRTVRIVVASICDPFKKWTASCWNLLENRFLRGGEGAFKPFMCLKNHRPILVMQKEQIGDATCNRRFWAHAADIRVKLRLQLKVMINKYGDSRRFRPETDPEDRLSP